jgi:hypothetical protein
MAASLRDLCRDWEKWAATADRNVDGWQEEYPAWPDLMEAATAAMRRRRPSTEGLRDIELCWAISNEGGHLERYAEEHIDQCWEILSYLVTSIYPDARWQAYSVLGFAGQRAETLLRAGLEDPDSYCRRRALLSLANLEPQDAKQIAEQFLINADPYLRLAALTMVQASKDTEFISRVKEQLSEDNADFVRESASKLGEPNYELWG